MKGAIIRTIGGPGALRLLLALAVFAYHLSSVAVGAAAVDVFFVLSGFWISRMWADRYSRLERPYFTYMVSRLWRLLPVFLLITALAIGCDVMRGETIPVNLHQIVSNLAIFGYASLPVQLLVPAWSLDIELQFYVLAPALIWLARRSARMTGATAVVLSGISMAMGWHANVAPFLVFFVIGILAERSKWQPSTAAAIAPLGAAAVGLVALVASPWRGVMLGGTHPGPLFGFNGGLNIVLAVCVVPYALWTTRRRGGALDPAFADLSYIIYLLHWITATLMGLYVAHLPVLPRAALTGTAVVVTLAIGTVIWATFDRPINKARGRWVRSRIDRVPVLVVPVAPEVTA